MYRPTMALHIGRKSHRVAGSHPGLARARSSRFGNPTSPHSHLAPGGDSVVTAVLVTSDLWHTAGTHAHSLRRWGLRSTTGPTCTRDCGGKTPQSISAAGERDLNATCSFLRVCALDHFCPRSCEGSLLMACKELMVGLFGRSSIGWYKTAANSSFCR